MMLDKKQIQVILFKFKMGRKALETTCNIHTLGLGTATKCIVQLRFKKFCKGDKSPED